MIPLYGNAGIDKTAAMTVDEVSWFGVRTVAFFPSLSVYEERVTIWKAASLDDALELAEAEGQQYCDTHEARWCGLAQAYRIGDAALTAGSEVFSLMRTSDLDHNSYVSAFFDTGAERQAPSPAPDL